MKILLFGAGGQLGHELASLLPLKGEVEAVGRDRIDMADPAELRGLLVRSRPKIIVNAIAYNQVDLAEAEPEAALRVNAEAVATLGEYARREGAALIHYSTDFVFDGKKGAPYVETDPTNPLSAYGRSKLAGERALMEMQAPALVLRTAWVYSLRRKSFVSMMLKLAREKKEMKIVEDQVGSPTWCRDLARARRSASSTSSARTPPPRRSKRVASITQPARARAAATSSRRRRSSWIRRAPSTSSNASSPSAPTRSRPPRRALPMRRSIVARCVVASGSRCFRGERL